MIERSLEVERCLNSETTLPSFVRVAGVFEERD